VTRVLPRPFRVLITVKTYPRPSRQYEELVCMAGVEPTLGFVRLYPISFRRLPYEQQYRKYQWIEVTAIKNASDPRPDSYRPRADTIRAVGKPLPAGDWAERKDVVLPFASESLEQIQHARREGGPSLGLFKPEAVSDFDWEATHRDWTPPQRARLSQGKLFAEDLTPLEKIPYDFRYRFRCNAPGCRTHHIGISDWEVGRLYLRMREQYAESTALEKVRDKFLTQLCGPTVDTYFFVGTSRIPYETWIILGVFYPPRQDQVPLPIADS